MKLKQRGGVWWVDFRLPTGQRRRVSTGVRVGDGEDHEARAMASAGSIVSREVATASGAAKPEAPATLAEAIERTYVEHWSRTKSATIVRRVCDLMKREVGGWTLSGVTYAGLRDYCEARLRDGIAPATVNRRMSLIGVVLREASRRGEIPSRPDVPHYPEQNKRERYLTNDEERAVFGWLSREELAELARGDDAKAAEWTYVRNLAAFLLDTGFRFSEAFKFTVERGCAVLRSGETKTDAARRVPLTARAKAAAEHLLTSPIHAARVREERTAGRDKAAWDWVSHRWQRATRAAGCPDVTLHILRHTCASRLVQRGVNLYVVKEWLGHSSIKVTERYAHLASDSLSGALAALEGRPVPVNDSAREEVPGHVVTPHVA